MKKITVGMLLGMTFAAVSLAGCGSETKEATEAVNESAQLEQAGSGDAVDTDTEDADEEEKTEETEEEVTEETEKAEKAEAEETEKTEAEETEAEEIEAADTEGASGSAGASEKAEASGDADASGDAEVSEDAEASKEEEEAAVKVGVLLPDSEEADWTSDEEALKTELEADGYEAKTAFAKDNDEQVSQIRTMMEEGIPALIIAPVDEYGLTEVLAETKEKGIYIFSYDDLIRDTDGVNYYVTFSGRAAGQMIGSAIVKEQGLDKAKEAGETKTIEFLMGSLDDSQALFFYNGVMEILTPYLEDGTLVCRSGRTSFEDTGVLRWGRDRAGRELKSILEEFYQDTEAPDIICTGFDDAACAAVDVLEERKLSKEDENWPMITGSGCEAEAVKYIAEGKVFCSLFMDRGSLAEECAKMVDTWLKGESPEVNDYQEYDNGKKIIGTYLCEAQLINEGNYESLIDRGYFEESEILPEEPGEDEEESEEDEAESGEDEEETREGQKTVGADGKQPAETDSESSDARNVSGSQGASDDQGTSGNQDSDAADASETDNGEDASGRQAPPSDIPEDSILSILGDTGRGL